MGRSGALKIGRAQWIADIRLDNRCSHEGAAGQRRATRAKGGQVRCLLRCLQTIPQLNSGRLELKTEGFINPRLQKWW